MKSIIQEASTITKAIEQGWQRAGCPESFSVKIFEKPEKNFLGLTKNNAKIGIFFEEKKPPFKRQSQHTKDSNRRPQEKARPNPPHAKNAYRKPQEKAIPKPPQKASLSRPTPKENIKQTREAGPRHQIKNPQNKAAEKIQSNVEKGWSPEMIDFVALWLKEALRILKKEHIEISTKIENKSLRLSLSKPLFDDAKKESDLLKSFEGLVMQAIQKQFNSPPGLSVIIGK